MTILRAGFGSRSVAYEIAKSLRFRASASAYLQRTLAAGNRKTLTVSFWMKLGRPSINGVILGYYQSSSNYQFVIRLDTDGALRLNNVQSGTVNLVKVTTQLFRDPSAWYHVCVAYDTTQAVADDRVKLFINGVQITSFSASTNPAQNTDLMINFVNQPLGIGRERANTSSSHGYFDGYMSEINFIDGQALDPSYFGQTDPVTGQWVPKKYTGSYGTNGFYLDFKDGTSLTTLGYDKSGNGNNWTLNNISLTAGATYDWMDDTPSNNFPVLNPLQSGNVAVGGTIRYANLQVHTATNGTAFDTYSSFYMSSGRYYVEAEAISNGGYGATTLSLYTAAGVLIGGATYGNQSGSLGFGVGGLAVDVDAGKLWLSNPAGAWLSGDPDTGSSPSFTFTPGTEVVVVLGISRTSGNSTLGVGGINFGQQPFVRTPPTGFKALCTKNLPAPQVRKGAGYFYAVLDSGASIKTACEALFGNFFEWIKDRANTNNHQLIDSVRGNTAVLQSNTAADETTYSAPSGGSVGWVWRIAAGFLDVVTYTGTGVARTVAHNLGVAPAMVVVKARTTAGADQGWPVYHKANTSAPETDYLLLNSTAATADLDTVWNDTPPTSSELTVGTNALVNTSGDDYVAYLFAEVPGFSKFGSYTGNGSATGPFVYCGFKPKFLMIKCSSTTGDWWMYDAERSPANPAVLKLLANTNGVEDVTGEDVDLLSNGFKIRSTAAGQNTNAATYVFAAFAECPFQNATAR